MPTATIPFLHRDCRWFNGDIPCKPHKKFGAHCHECSHYIPQKGRILLIKLGAIGDVIRTTPLIAKIREVYPHHALWWLTHTPDILPSAKIERILPLTTGSMEVLHQTPFDVVINLDKDLEACAIAKAIPARYQKFGFTLTDGRPSPCNDLANHKFATGLFDDINQANEQSYVEEIFSICGWKFQGEEYALPLDTSFRWDIPADGKPIIGLNTGCGGRWTSRLWGDENWVELIALLQKNGLYPLLLGGEQEHEMNTRLAEKTGAAYLGHFSLHQFISLMNQCDTIVSAVTMAMHIAIGLKKPLILFVNIFNPHEFELYGRGEILQPEAECKCYFAPRCKEPSHCMNTLSPQSVSDAVKRALL
jgi:heptosyltransferase-2